ncbi:ethanolamine ammonia-lyase subunit EutC [Arenibaculum pallidiluteum]|uniref:ethanolamine ammonia-lyase subunit EutC n=1 Tax=Arenibaculum pallidiluteum TaxID=2812559 RepID=UPI001A979421|nr:ethanolamine ammonia-lyase subunit EutC [Arenibaculum pallidiluteum]
MTDPADTASRAVDPGTDPGGTDTGTVDPWARMRGLTRARIGLGRCGDGLPTRALLDFQLAHARARDAVHAEFDAVGMAAALAPLPTVAVRSRAPDRAAYLQRPDLGRLLDPSDEALLEPGDWDAVFVVADGLSAAAVHAHAAPVVRETLKHLPGWRIGPVVLASQGRVALGDEIGIRLGARLVALLVGERPGLSAADSLGAYLTWEPRPGRRDAERNCISNIRPPEGLGHAAAGAKLAWLMVEASRRGLTGIGLKDETPALPGGGPAGPAIVG